MNSLENDVEDPLQPDFHRCFTGHTGAITSLHYSPASLSSTYEFISASTDCSLILWKYRPHLSAYRLAGHTRPVTCVRYHPLARAARVASSSLDGTVRIWDTQPSRSLAASSTASSSSSAALTSHCHVTSLHTAVHNVDWDARGEFILSACADDTVKVHRIPQSSSPSRPLSPHLTGTIYGHLAPVTSALFTPDSRLVASSSLDASVRLHDFHTLRTLTRYSHYTHPVTSLAIHPSGTLLSSLSHHSLSVIDTRSHHLLQLYNLAPAVPTPHPSAPAPASSLISFSPGGGELYAGGEDGLTVIDLRSGRVRWRVQGHEGPVTAVAVRADDAFVTGGDDQRLCTWHVIRRPSPPSPPPTTRHPLSASLKAPPNIARPSRRDLLYSQRASTDKRSSSAPFRPLPRPQQPLRGGPGCGYAHAHTGRQDGRVLAYAGKREDGGRGHVVDFPLLHGNKSRVYRSAVLHAEGVDDLVARLPTELMATLREVEGQLGAIGSRVQGLQGRMERCETRLGRVGSGLDEELEEIEHEEKYPD